MRKVGAFVVTCAVIGSLMTGCSGGGSDSSDSDVCSTLKIAGGSECYDPPKAIVVVRTPNGYCSGTFITTRQVLTAAHCFAAGTSGVSILTQYFSYSAVKIQVHPSFNPNVPSDQNDVAIVTVGADAPVTPVPLRLSSDTQAGDTVVTYGYGLDQNDDTYGQRVESGEAALKATSLDVIGVSDFAVKSISDGSGDTCQGDSGGSLLIDGNNGQPGIVAIVRAGPLPCQSEGGPSDNTNIQASSVLNFITSAAPGVAVN
jgi:secreted trypsin-like serine protease